MSFARDLGAEAAASGLTATTCPYAGRSTATERLRAGSERLRRRWMDGYEKEMRRLIDRREDKQHSRRPDARRWVTIRLTQIAQERR